MGPGGGRVGDDGKLFRNAEGRDILMSLGVSMHYGTRSLPPLRPETHPCTIPDYLHKDSIERQYSQPSFTGKGTLVTQFK